MKRASWAVCAAAVVMMFAVTSDVGAATPEKISVFRIYSWNYLFLTNMTSMLKTIGATSEPNGLIWHYTYPATGKSFNIYYYDSKDEMITALKTPGAHIVTGGHSNYGLGPFFTLASQGNSKTFSSVKYVDDPQFLFTCGDFAYVDPEGECYGQAYPNWKPVFSNGSSAQAPFTPDEGLPPYNYFISYKLPGDPATYTVELSDGSHIVKFPDSGLPVWWQVETKPDPTVNPEYFMIYPYPDWNRCSYTGGSAWSTSTNAPVNTYCGFNFGYRTGGTGSRTAVYSFYLPMAGTWEVKATWPALSDNASNATYKINNALGTTTKIVDQRSSATTGWNMWNSLGTYTFNKGTYTVVLSDAGNGRVCADAIELYPLSNPTNVVSADFHVSRKSGSAPLPVTFYNYSIVMAGAKSWSWNFGDGSTSTDQAPTHTYASSGIYTVSLTVTDNLGHTSTEKKTNFIVVGSYTMAVAAQFAASGRTGDGTATLLFNDQSTGSITSWLWDFGDGTTSTQRYPSHVYYWPGSYAVKLTVSGSGGTSSMTKQNYAYVNATPAFCDNVTKYKPPMVNTSWTPWSTPKIALDMADYRMQPTDMKYSRLIWATCVSGRYFLDTFQHGIVFCTVENIEHYTAVNYLQNYMQGVSDADNINRLNQIQTGHAMVDFSKKPPSMQ